MSVCTKCHREFAADGFCPFDGTPLSESNDDYTLAEPEDTNTGSEVDYSQMESVSTAEMEAERASANKMAAAQEVPYEGSLLQGGSAVQRVLDDARNSRDRLIGAVLDDRYQIEKQIGEGGMGVVYLARHIVIEKPVAIKILRPEVAREEGVVTRFVQEARAASRIGHPNIIDVTDFGATAEGMTYQVMEYLEGRTLAKLLQETPCLPLPQALSIVVQMARALGAAHDKGIVHRDLKPENIFLLERDGKEEFVKIVDFGIAKVAPADNDPAVPRLTRAGSVFGTPEYMAPEQAAGRTDVDHRADVYALGIILYQMLVGDVPHRGESTVRTLAMQMLEEPVPPLVAKPDLQIGEDMQDAILRAITKHRDRRFQSMQEFIAALEAATSSTELDLPLLLHHERLSAQMDTSDLAGALPNDTVVDPVAAFPEHNQAPPAEDTTRRARASSAAAIMDPRAHRATDPAFLRKTRQPTDFSSETQAPVNGQGKWAVVGIALLLSGGVAMGFVWHSARKSSSSAEKELASAEPPALLAADAALADSTANLDAGWADAHEALALTTQPDSGISGSNEVRPIRPVHKLPEGEVEVTIITRPSGASLFIGNSYAGSDGLHLRRPAGERVTVTCQLNRYLDGSVRIRFDGKREVFLCKLTAKHRKRCVEGIKNPFYDCPE